jgi:hypothetical protein
VMRVPGMRAILPLQAAHPALWDHDWRWPQGSRG